MEDNPEISPDVDNQGGVQMEYDFRSVYGSILMDWFGLEQQVVQGLLYEAFEYIPVLLGCSPTSSSHIHLEETGINVYPNPTDNIFRITGVIGACQVRILDANGVVYQSSKDLENVIQYLLNAIKNKVPSIIKTQVTL